MNENLIYGFVIFILVAFALVIFAVGRYIAKASKIAKQLDAELAARGVTTEAKISNKRSQSFSRGSDRYYLQYQFNAAANGKSETRTKEVEVILRDYNKLNVGDPLTLRYLPDNPDAIHIESPISNVNSASNLRYNSILLYIMGGFILGLAVVGSGAFIALGQTNAQATATQIARNATPNEAGKTATAVAFTLTLQADNATAQQISTLIAASLPEWKKVNDQVRHIVTPPEAAIKLGGLRVDYGYCESGYFYVYVWVRVNSTIKNGSTTFRDMDGYAYIEGSQPPNCYPKEMSSQWLGDVNKLDNNWYALSHVSEVIQG